MEKKKLLLVAVSVGVFLVLVIVAAALIFSPGKALTGNPEAGYTQVRTPVFEGTVPSEYGISGDGSAEQPASMDAADIIRNSSEIPGLQPYPGIQQKNNFYITGSGGNPERTAVIEPEEPRVRINVPRPSTAAVPDASPPPRPAAVPAPAAPAAAEKNPVPAPAARPAAPAQSPARVYNTYWIQTGAFTVKSRAEGARETLASRGITSIIENRDIDGKTFFRVRVGPYTSKNEADYWLSLVKAMDGFEDSQIRQTSSTTANSRL